MTLLTELSAAEPVFTKSPKPGHRQGPAGLLPFARSLAASPRFCQTKEPSCTNSSASRSSSHSSASASPPAGRQARRGALRLGQLPRRQPLEQGRPARLALPRRQLARRHVADAGREEEVRPKAESPKAEGRPRFEVRKLGHVTCGCANSGSGLLSSNSWEERHSCRPNHHQRISDRNVTAPSYQPSFRLLACPRPRHSAFELRASFGLRGFGLRPFYNRPAGSISRPSCRPSV